MPMKKRHKQSMKKGANDALAGRPALKGNKYYLRGYGRCYEKLERIGGIYEHI